MISGDKTKFWNQKIEKMPREEMRVLQMKRLKKQLMYKYNHSLFYRKKFDGVGMKNEDIKDLDDFREIPLTNTNAIIPFTPHPPLPLKGGG